MDNFIDKLAQKFGSQDMIKANAEAEAKENERLRGQLEEYDKRIQEIRQLNLKNLEIADRLEKLSQSGTVQNDQLIKETHNECVRVYRNVEAVVDAGFNMQQDVIEEESLKIQKKASGVKPMLVITMLLSAAAVALQVLQILEVF